VPYQLYIQNFIQHPSVRVNSMCRINYWDHQCRFQHNKSPTDHIFCICQIFKKNWDCSVAVCQLFIDFKKAYVSVQREVLYNILIEFCIPLKLVREIKMCLNQTYSRVWEGRHMPDTFPTQCVVKRGSLSLLLFNLALEYVIRRLQAKQEGLNLSGAH
jgi:hypothetical protein